MVDLRVSNLVLREGKKVTTVEINTSTAQANLTDPFVGESVAQVNALES